MVFKANGRIVEHDETPRSMQDLIGLRPQDLLDHQTVWMKQYSGKPGLGQVYVQVCELFSVSKNIRGVLHCYVSRPKSALTGCHFAD